MKGLIQTSLSSACSPPCPLWFSSLKVDGQWHQGEFWEQLACSITRLLGLRSVKSSLFSLCLLFSFISEQFPLLPFFLVSHRGEEKQAKHRWKWKIWIPEPAASVSLQSALFADSDWKMVCGCSKHPQNHVETGLVSPFAGRLVLYTMYVRFSNVAASFLLPSGFFATCGYLQLVWYRALVLVCQKNTWSHVGKFWASPPLQDCKVEIPPLSGPEWHSLNEIGGEKWGGRREKKEVGYGNLINFLLLYLWFLIFK